MLELGNRLGGFEEIRKIYWLGDEGEGLLGYFYWELGLGSKVGLGSGFFLGFCRVFKARLMI